MTVDPIPVHGHPQRSGREAELEVDPWPHVHVYDDEWEGRPAVTVRLLLGADWTQVGTWHDIEKWTIHVAEPSRLMRLLSGGRVTLESRVDDAVETLRERWDDLVEERRRAYDAAVRYDG